MYRLLISFIIMLSFATVLFGQDTRDEKIKEKQDRRRRVEDEQKQPGPDRGARTAPQDTTGSGREGDVAAPDTSKLIKVESALYWYDMSNRLSTKSDTSRYEIFRLADEKALIYTGMSDIARNRALWYQFNLSESGRPSFLALTNTLPHQTPLWYGRMRMNDVVSGQFDTRFIPLNFVQYAEADYTRGYIQNPAGGTPAGLSITSHSVHTPQPWTKIMYKQGSYGYSDLDISFGLPFNENFALQLGGMRSLYDGTMPDVEHEGANYRAEFTWQYSPAFYIRGHMLVNRQKAGMTSFDNFQSLTTPYIVHNRDDFFLDLTWVQDDSNGQRLHAVFHNSYDMRKLTDKYAFYKLETKSKDYTLDVNNNFFLGSNEITVGAGGSMPQVFGYPFHDDPGLLSLNAYGDVRMPLADWLGVRAGVQATYHQDQDPFIDPAVGIDVRLKKIHNISLDAAVSHRIPNATERFFNFDSISGNPDLQAERFILFHGGYSLKTSDSWHLRLDGGYQRIENEIVWWNEQFSNTNVRDYMFFAGEGFVRLWQFDLGGGGQYTLADVHVTPQYNVWAQLHFNYTLLNGALIIDAYGTAYHNASHRAINYELRLNRFYTGFGEADPITNFNWKIVGKVQDANIFFEMDNVLSADYEVIGGYWEFYRRFRFGINWVLLD